MQLLAIGIDEGAPRDRNTLFLASGVDTSGVFGHEDLVAEIVARAREGLLRSVDVDDVVVVDTTRACRYAERT